ncbi:MAG: hypothetical protein FWD08_06215, partial [Alphaproteobacteria bacterium]|nr:hypothetical protein [Alphaproteobacteria bacterium]
MDKQSQTSSLTKPRYLKTQCDDLDPLEGDMQRDSDHELKLLDNILHGVAADYTTDKPLTGFLAMIGDKYTGELMVAGRAVNGWADALTARDLGDETARSTVTREIYRSVSSGPCPMLWVTNQWRVEKGKYSTARSQFWRV